MFIDANLLQRFQRSNLGVGLRIDKNMKVMDHLVYHHCSAASNNRLYQGRSLYDLYSSQNLTLSMLIRDKFLKGTKLLDCLDRGVLQLLKI